MTKIEQIKSNQIVPVDDPKLPATSKSIDPFKAYADEVAPQNIIGTLLKFNKGDYSVGKEGRAIPVGSKFAANLDLMAVGYVKWIGGRPVNHMLVRLADGSAKPKRAQLGDLAEDAWEMDSDGKSRDPWQQVNYLPLLDERGEIYTFSVSGRSALKEAASLCRTYAFHLENQTDEFPVVELGVGRYLHKDRSIGWVKYPEINVVGWTPKAHFVKALAAAGFMVMPETQPAEETSSSPAKSSADEEPPAITEIPDGPDGDMSF